MRRTEVTMAIKLRKGDEVEVLAGKDLGRRGTITRVIPETNRVIVDGVNMAKKHQKPTRATMQGGIIDKEMPIHISNVALVCRSCGPTRVGYRVEGDNKVRICRKCEKGV
jgi:large subunit ribosomal protein L24